MRDVRDLQIKGRIANHQQTRVYTRFAIRSFRSTNLAHISKKSANANFSFGDA